MLGDWTRGGARDFGSPRESFTMSAHEECSRCNLVSGHDAATKSAAADGAVATAVADAATAAADPHRTASPRLKRRQCACCGPVSTANLALRAHCAAGVPGGCDTTVMVGCQGCGGTAGNVFRSAICMAKFAADLLDTRSRHNTYSTECLSVFGLVDWKAVAKGNVLVADVADKYSTVFIVNARGELMWRYTCPWCYGRCVELPRPRLNGTRAHPWSKSIVSASRRYSSVLSARSTRPSRRVWNCTLAGPTTRLGTCTAAAGSGGSDALWVRTRGRRAVRGGGS